MIINNIHTEKLNVFGTLFKSHSISLQITRPFSVIDFSVFNESWKDPEILDKFNTDYKILLALDLNAWLSLMDHYSYRMMCSLSMIQKGNSFF